GRIAELIDEVVGQQQTASAAAKPTRPARLTNIQKIQLIQQTINEQIRPALRADGGDVELIDVEGDKVIVAFRGMCAQCKMAEFTMRDVVEARLKEYVSESLTVEELKD
ncbi:MAG TPA: NifU family protein, partial [Phycisphaerales bacterium]|nr:NifU family protein [Phycisphaerales bacterium]